MAAGEAKIPVGLDTASAMQSIEAIKAALGNIRQAVGGTILSGGKSAFAGEFLGPLGQAAGAAGSFLARQVGAQQFQKFITDPAIVHQEAVSRAAALVPMGADKMSLEARQAIIRNQRSMLERERESARAMNDAGDTLITKEATKAAGGLSEEAGIRMSEAADKWMEIADKLGRWIYSTYSGER